MPPTTDLSSSEQGRAFVLPKSKPQSFRASYSSGGYEEEVFREPVDRHVFESSVSLIISGYSKQEARDLNWFIHSDLVTLIDDRVMTRRGRAYLSKLTLKVLKGLGHHSGVKSSDVVELADGIFELRTKMLGALRVEDMFVTLSEAAYKGKVLRFLYPDEKTGVLYVRRVKVKRLNTDNPANIWFDAESYAKDGAKSRFLRKDKRFRRYRLLKATEMLVEETPVRKLQESLVIVSSVTQDKLTTSVQSYDALSSVATY